MAQSPVRPADDDARRQAAGLLRAARFGALAFTDADGNPMVTRIGLALGDDGSPMALISQLSAHTPALAADPRFALMVGEPGSRGDPLTHPRLTIRGRARLVQRSDPAFAGLARDFIRQRPKAKLYMDFADFLIARFPADSGHLNGGFGRAHLLQATDLGMPGTDIP